MLCFCFALASISIHLTLAVSSSEAELLWRVTNHAIQRRQSYNSWNVHTPHPSWSRISQPFMEALDSIASNDALHCVPRLLCELTSGQAQTSKDLPFNINAEPLFGLMSTANNLSPVATFAKAVLLGFSSRGDLSSCYRAYSTCPKDPDRLVQYLNNYNGGFFRFFSGIPQQFPVRASKRILNNYGDSGDRLTFHAGLRSPKTLTFPSDKETMFERPPVGHVKVPMVFPDRTGTGELRLDTDELAASSNELYGDYNRFKLKFPGEDF